MKKTFLSFFVLIVFTVSSLAQNELENKKEKEAIKKVIQEAYIDGLINEGDFEKINKGFHPGFNLLGIGRGNEMWNYPIYSWKESVKHDLKIGAIPKKDNEKVTIKFLTVDITGTAAVAKIEFYVGEKLTYIDYLSLYKFADGWKIVNKIFYQFPESKDEK